MYNSAVRNILYTSEILSHRGTVEKGAVDENLFSNDMSEEEISCGIPYYIKFSNKLFNNVTLDLLPES